MTQNNSNEKTTIKTFPLETGIEPPPPDFRGSRKYAFPLLEMEINQSFSMVSKNEVSACRNHIKDFDKKNPEDKRHWTTRKIGENEYRCWRVS